ncbi:hypothetical protein [Lyngbya sp. CCY1209]|uniref:hypothetical protein n=1 Tax=Lyngbya sp. CCY1209 TaxID=2886103 RepID=UPI002D1FF183|nr:hypothetical protein [Lyngbya sp. CCY1209]MEB3886138.1 hypothetical protein [Lyngbya sp. CCY1209]
MNFIFLPEGITASLNPILTLIAHKPEAIVGCVLLAENEPECLPPQWFIDATLADNPAEELSEREADGEKLGSLSVFLIVKEPDSLLQLTVLAAVNCCNLNVSGAGGRGGKSILKALAQQNIRTYPAEVACPPHYSDDSKLREAMKKKFDRGFGVVAKDWLPESWGFEPVSYSNF